MIPHNIVVFTALLLCVACNGRAAETVYSAAMRAHLHTYVHTTINVLVCVYLRIVYANKFASDIATFQFLKLTL